MSNQNILIISRITKNFKDTKAVDNLSLSVKKGSKISLLGPNGAGKTTLVKMLCTIMRPTSGTAYMNRINLLKDPYKIRQNIGVVFQDQSIDEELTARENMNFHGQIYGLPNSLIKERINNLLEIVELKEYKDKEVSKFSGGMKRRLEIARSLIHTPKILFLDEPTVGLDPQTRTKIWDYINFINSNYNTTIILTTHYMEEADKLCDRVAIIDAGKIIANDTPENLKNNLKGDTIEIELDKPQDLFDILHKEKDITRILKNEKSITLSTKKAGKKIPGIMLSAEKNNIRIESISIHKPSLEDVYLHFTGKHIRKDTLSNKNSSIFHKIHRRN